MSKTGKQLVFQFKIIQGHRPWCQSKTHKLCNFLLVITSNFGSIWYRFQDIDA